MSKQVIKNYSFNAVAKTVTLSDFSAGQPVKLERLALITDTTINQIIYNFADPTLTTASVSSNNIITFTTLPAGAASGDKLRIDYDVVTGDPTYDSTVLPTNAAQETGGNLATIAGSITTGKVQSNTSQIGGTAVATAAAGVQKVGVADGSGNGITSTSNALDVNIKSGGSSGVSAADEAAWAAGSSTFAPTGGVFNDTATALTTGQEGTARVTTNRALHANIRNASGTELATGSNPLRTDPTGTTTQPVSGTVTVNALPSGTNTIGGVELVDSGGTNKASISAGGAIKVDGSAVTQPVTDATLGLSQASTTSGQKGPLVQGAVTTGAPGYTTAQTSPLSLDTSGNLRTSVNNTVTVSGTVTTTPPANASVNVNQVGGNAVATAASGIAKVGLTDGSGTALNSTSNALNVSVQNASVAVTESGIWTVQPGNTANTTPWLTTDSSDKATGNAVPASASYQGAQAKTALPTAASDGNIVGMTADKFGRLIVVTESVREQKANIPVLTLTSSTTETTLIGQAASTFNDITSIIVENTSAAATEVVFKDSTGGTVQFAIYVPAGDTRGFANCFFKQTTANNNWTATCTTSVASIKISGTFVKNQ